MLAVCDCIQADLAIHPHSASWRDNRTYTHVHVLLSDQPAGQILAVLAREDRPAGLALAAPVAHRDVRCTSSGSDTVLHAVAECFSVGSRFKSRPLCTFES